MRFTIPQFIEREPKIVGPLTFNQFIYLGIAAAICFFLYFSLPFPLFLLACFLIGGAALSIAFFKVDGVPLLIRIGNFLKFTLSPKMYLWKMQKGSNAGFVEKTVEKEEIPEDQTPLKIAARSKLKNKKTEIETKKINQ